MSFLCDRKTTAVAQSQPGFVNFIVAPLFNTLVEVMPQLLPLLEQAKENAKTWTTYVETEKDKLIYTKEVKFEAKAVVKSESSRYTVDDDDDSTTIPPILDVKI